jgi:hypothetical protein
MKTFMVIIAMAACCSVFGQSDSVINSLDNATFAKIVKQGNDFRLVAWKSAETASGVVLTVPASDVGQATSVIWSVRPLKMAGSFGLPNDTIQVAALASRKSYTGIPPDEILNDSLWIFKMSPSGVVKKTFIIAQKSTWGSYASRQSFSGISVLSNFGAPALFCAGEIGYTGTVSVNMYMGRTFFFNETYGMFHEFDVYQSVSVGAVDTSVKCDSIYALAQDYNANGNFMIRIVTDTGTIYYHGNLFGTPIAMKPKAESSTSSFHSLFVSETREYDFLGRRILGSRATAPFIIRQQNGAAKIVANFDRQR